MEDNSHYEQIKRIVEEAGVDIEERPQQKWGSNYKGGTVTYNVLRVGTSRVDFLFDEAGVLKSVSQ